MMRLVTSCITRRSSRTPTGATLLRALSVEHADGLAANHRKGIHLRENQTPRFCSHGQLEFPSGRGRHASLQGKHSATHRSCADGTLLPLLPHRHHIDHQFNENTTPDTHTSRKTQRTHDKHEGQRNMQETQVNRETYESIIHPSRSTESPRHDTRAWPTEKYEQRLAPDRPTPPTGTMKRWTMHCTPIDEVCAITRAYLTYSGQPRTPQGRTRLLVA